jgi:hypothetical protein
MEHLKSLRDNLPSCATDPGCVELGAPRAALVKSRAQFQRAAASGRSHQVAGVAAGAPRT